MRIIAQRTSQTGSCSIPVLMIASTPTTLGLTYHTILTPTAAARPPLCRGFRSLCAAVEMEGTPLRSDLLPPTAHATALTALFNIVQSEPSQQQSPKPACIYAHTAHTNIAAVDFPCIRLQGVMLCMSEYEYNARTWMPCAKQKLSPSYAARLHRR